MKRKILVVEDDWGTAEIIKSIVTRGGYEAHLASDGRDAVEKARAVSPHVILLDAMLPGMDGYAVCRVLRNEPAFNKTRIIMLTSLTQIGDAEKAFQVGANDFMGKPFTMERLLQKIQKNLGE
jgi:DNA-binding response OmpR family regulator